MKRNLALKAAIVRLFDTQANFAKELGKGWDDARISKIISGREILTEAEQEMFAQKLEIDVAEIFGDLQDGI